MYKKIYDTDEEDKVTIDEIIIDLNGKSYKIINCHPILTQEEKDKRHQEFLKTADRILKKYDN